jgi:hypothetical protein
LATNRFVTTNNPDVGMDFQSDFYSRKTISIDYNTNPYTLGGRSSSSYASLGTTSDVNEATIQRAYVKQIMDDPANTIFYLECLQDIAQSTSNRTLTSVVERELERGLYTRFELERSYKVLEIDHPDDIDDEGILAVFQSRCIDVPNRQTDFQHALGVISYFRKITIGDGGTPSQSEEQEG